MAIVTTRVTVTTAATAIATNSAADPGESDYRTRSFVVKNVGGTTAIFLGPTGVTTATGLQWDVADGPLSVDLEPGESIYGIVSSGTQTLHVLAAGR